MSKNEQINPVKAGKAKYRSKQKDGPSESSIKPKEVVPILKINKGLQTVLSMMKDRTQLQATLGVVSVCVDGDDSDGKAGRY